MTDGYLVEGQEVRYYKANKSGVIVMGCFAILLLFGAIFLIFTPQSDFYSALMNALLALGLLLFARYIRDKTNEEFDAWIAYRVALGLKNHKW